MINTEIKDDQAECGVNESFDQPQRHAKECSRSEKIPVRIAWDLQTVVS
jgi:hypothetical protein